MYTSSTTDWPRGHTVADLQCSAYWLRILIFDQFSVYNPNRDTPTTEKYNSHRCTLPTLLTNWTTYTQPILLTTYPHHVTRVGVSTSPPILSVWKQMLPNPNFPRYHCIFCLHTSLEVLVPPTTGQHWRNLTRQQYVPSQYHTQKEQM